MRERTPASSALGWRMHIEPVQTMVSALRSQPKLWRADTVEDSLSLDRMQELLTVALAALGASGFALVPCVPSPREIQVWEDASPSMDGYFEPDGHFMASYQAFLAVADRIPKAE